MAGTPQLPRRGQAPRPPRIIINNIPPYGQPIMTPQMQFTAATSGHGGIPFTAATTGHGGMPFTAATGATMPGSMGPPMWPPYATSYFTKGFEGFRDFTKTGLSFGEKSAFWLYEKFSRWSKKWFTHFFLFTVVLLYSIVGALIFTAVEGPNENNGVASLRRERDNFMKELRLFAEDKELLRDPDLWEMQVLAHIRQHKSVLQDSFNPDYPRAKWSFWNAMFYCGTIYTTIGMYEIVFFLSSLLIIQSLFSKRI